ncbi:hypothetical protein K501DRAFT_246139 [Backusella circina FSU 941]|nr:hypothetical protein K501DRAFT_246139 [Backusella circina FSU 941]
MNQNFNQRLIHSSHAYIYKCCGCIQLRAGSTVSCLIWAGLSLYFSILSFQAKSPFFSYLSATALYIFGTVNLILFGVSLGVLFSLFLKSSNAVRVSAIIAVISIIAVLIDTFANVILFIVHRSVYVEWCINTTSTSLGDVLNNSFPPNTTEEFSVTMADFYNCNRTWEDELKFSVLGIILLIVLYLYWWVCLYSYSIKLRSIERARFVEIVNRSSAMRPMYP